MKTVKLFILLLLSAVSCTSVSFAQKTLSYEFSGGQLASGASYGYVKVLDKRIEQEHVGYLKRGAFSQKSFLVPEPSLADAMAGFGNRLLQGKTTSGDTLLVVLYDFMLEHLPHNEPVATFYLKARCFVGKNDSYKLAMDVDSMYEAAGVGFADSLVAGSGRVVFDIFKAVAEQHDFDGAALSYAQALAYEQEQKKQFPIYNASAFTKGVYRTYDDFMNNSPMDTGFIKKEDYKDDVSAPHFYYKTAKGKKGDRVDSVYAIFDGRFWYKYSKNGWRSMRFENGDFYYKRYFAGTVTRDERAEIVRKSWSLFGVIGAAAAYAATDGMEPEAVKSRCYYDTRLNPFKRKLVPVNRLGIIR